MKHTTKELGGKAPNIIFAGADIDRAVQAAFWGIFWNKGEVCVAGSRLLMERPVYDEVVEKLSRMAKSAILGDPLEADTMIGPIATKPEYDKVLRYVEAGKQSSARLVAEGGVRPVDGKGLFIEPTVFADASNELKISREEIFGPVLPVIAFEGRRRRSGSRTIHRMVSLQEFRPAVLGALYAWLTRSRPARSGSTLGTNTIRMLHSGATRCQAMGGSKVPRRWKVTRNTKRFGPTWLEVSA